MSKVKHYIVKPGSYAKLMELARQQVGLRRHAYLEAQEVLDEIEKTTTTVLEDSFAKAKPISPSIKAVGSET